MQIYFLKYMSLKYISDLIYSKYICDIRTNNIYET